MNQTEAASLYPTTTDATAVSTGKNSATDGVTILGKYKLGRLLGRGNFAKVYQAQSLIDQTSVAVKVIDSKTVSAEMEPRIIREVSAMRRLHHHPNILKIHEVMATKSKIYLVMEIATGGELFQKIVRHGRLTESAARRYFHQLISALSFCHENGVAHRDMKPQNLLLDHEGNLKIADFGLSALPEQLKNGLLDTACGTPAYTAPEVFRRRDSNGYNGEQSDAWSCGVILFVFLAGRMPFDDSNLVNMYKKINRREYQFPTWISKSARSIIAQLLDPNPKTRLTIKALTDHKWFKKSPLARSQSCTIFQSHKFDTITSWRSQSINAFDLISMSSGLDLSGLFESIIRKKQRFTTGATMEVIEQRTKEVGEKLGFAVENNKNGKIGLLKGRLIMLIEIKDLTQTMLMVDLKLVDGVSVDFEDVFWADLKAGFEDLVVSWHTDVL